MLNGRGGGLRRRRGEKKKEKKKRKRKKKEEEKKGGNLRGKDSDIKMDTSMWVRFAQDNKDEDLKAGDAGLNGIKQNVSLTG